jgi:GNAT superfamily N-acetyltransferase
MREESSSLTWRPLTTRDAKAGADLLNAMGVASALIGHALRAAADRGYDRVSLRVDSANPFGASGVYEKAGFTSKSRFVRWALEG